MRTETRDAFVRIAQWCERDVGRAIYAPVLQTVYDEIAMLEAKVTELEAEARTAALIQENIVLRRVVADARRALSTDIRR